MGKYSGIFLCSDFDGTLAYKEEVPKANIDAIKYFCQNGGIFSVVSGRTLEFLNGYADDLCLNSYVACVNGTQIFHRPTATPIRTVYLPDGALKSALSIFGASSQFTDVGVFTDDGHFSLCLSDESFTDRLCDFFKKPVFKLLAHKATDITDEEVRLIKGAFGSDYEISRSWAQGLEISSANANKGVAARAMASLVGAEYLVCVGDYENDISLLKAADTSYAVANALPAVKKIASRVTVDVREGAIAAIIEEIS